MVLPWSYWELHSPSWVDDEDADSLSDGERGSIEEVNDHVPSFSVIRETVAPRANISDRI